MTNEIRGERAVVIAGRSLDVALTMATLAELEAVFGTDFDQVSERLFRRETRTDGEPYPVPRAGPLAQFWRAVLTTNGHDPGLVDRPGVSPFALLRDALGLVRATQDEWFQSEREAADGRPLVGGRAGAIGCAPGSAGSASDRETSGP